MLPATAGSWFNLARLEMLSEFGQETTMRTLLEQILRGTEQQGGDALGRVKEAPAEGNHSRSMG
jgi:hypothetical protein